MIIHSPLVGPATAAPLAAALAGSGWTATVPDLRTASDSPGHFLEHAIAAAHANDVVIGHSGAGPFLPTVARAIDATAVVFVDAVVPTTARLWRPTAPLLRLLDTLPVVDGLLPPWHEWWPADRLTELVPDSLIRRRVTAEIPRVPRSFYDEAVPVPPRWWTGGAAYLQLSPAYDTDRAQAERWNWPTSMLDGRHLDLCVQPRLIAEQVVEFVRRLGPGPR